jgi:hypothetical protein
MTQENKPTEVVFAPGCFDNFEGTQEELDELIAAIHQAVQSGDLLENSNLVEDLSDEEIAELEMAFEKLENKTLQ